MNKEQKQLERWKRIKSRGMFSHMIKRGAVCYGIVFFLTWVFIVPFIDHRYSFGFVYNETFKDKVIIIWYRITFSRDINGVFRMERARKEI